MTTHPKLIELRLDAERFRAEASSLSERRLDVLRRIRSIEDHERSVERLGRKLIAAQAQELEGLRLELRHMDQQRELASRRHADTRAVLQACERYAGGLR